MRSKACRFQQIFAIERRSYYSYLVLHLHEYALVRNEIMEAIEKTAAVSMIEHENLAKVKTKKSEEKYLNFANLAIQEFCDDIELQSWK